MKRPILRDKMLKPVLDDKYIGDGEDIPTMYDVLKSATEQLEKRNRIAEHNKKLGISSHED